MTEENSGGCDDLVPKRGVERRDRYHEVLLLGVGIDADVNPPPPAGETVLGLPPGMLWNLTPSKYADLVKVNPGVTPSIQDYVAQNQAGVEFATGIGGVALPGQSVQQLPAQQHYRVDEGALDLKNQTVATADGDRRLSSAQMNRLITGGRVVLGDAESGMTVLEPAKLTVLEPADAPVSGQQLTFSTAASSGWEYNTSGLTKLGVGVHGCRYLRAAAASPYSGEEDVPAAWRDDEVFPPWLVSKNSDHPDYEDAVRDLIAAARKHPKWAECTKRGGTVIPAASYPIGIATVYESLHTLLDYRRGEMVESVSLGPEEEVVVEVFRWDRETTERTEESRVSTESERTSEASRSTEAEVASTIATSVGASAGGELGLGLPTKIGKVDIGANSSVSVDTSKELASTVNTLAETTVSAARRFQSEHQVTTVTKRETGLETRTTRRFRNPNLARTLHLHHYQVDAHYKVQTSVVESDRLVVAVENPAIGPFDDREWVLAHHHFLSRVLPSDVYREGLAAARVLQANTWAQQRAAAEAAEAVDAARERSRLAEEEAAAADGWLDSGIFATARQVRNKLLLLLGDADESQLEQADADESQLEQALATLLAAVNRLNELTVDEVQRAEERFSRWAWWTSFTAAYPSMPAVVDEFLKTVGRDDASGTLAQGEPGAKAEAERKTLTAIGSLVAPLDDEWVVALKQFGPPYLLTILAAMSYVITGPLLLLLTPYLTKLMVAPNDLGLPRLLSRLRVEYEARHATDVATGNPTPAPAAETYQPADVPAPPRAYTLREVAEATAAFTQLVAHLNARKTHYTNQWYAEEDPGERLQRLQSMNLGRFVENRLLGFSGDRSLFPLRVTHLSQTTKDLLTKLQADAKAQGESVNVTEREYTLPTVGVTTEAVLGDCEALEPYLVARRYLELAERRLKVVEAAAKLGQPMPAGLDALGVPGAAAEAPAEPGSTGDPDDQGGPDDPRDADS